MTELNCDIVECTVCGTRFGFRADAVREIVRLGPVTPVPLAPVAVKGLTTVRGHIVTLHDVAKALDLGASAAVPMIVVVEYGKELHGLCVDTIGRIIPGHVLAEHVLHVEETWKDVSGGVWHDGTSSLTLLHPLPLIERSLA